MSRTLLVMAAGSGGHIFPGLAIAKELASRGWKIVWMGTPGGMENKLVAAAGYRMEQVSMSGVRGKGKLAWFLLPLRLIIAFWQSTVVIFRVRPDVVLSMGGYIAFPGGMMASLWGKPLVVHEPGATAGLANRVLALLADRVLVGMPGAFDEKPANAIAARLPKPKKVEWSGTPIRDEIAQVAEPQTRYAGRSGRLRLLVVGGSLGAQTLSELVVAALKGLAEGERPEVVHQSGEKHFEQLGALYREAGVRAEVLAFIDDIAARYGWCDVLICRSGAITVAEIACAGVASILFPLPWFVADEQAGNARFLVAEDAGIQLRQLETTPVQLGEVLRSLTRERLAAMAARARALGKPDATRRCADACAELAHAA